MKRVACIFFVLHWTCERDHRRQEMLQEIFYKHTKPNDDGELQDEEGVAWYMFEIRHIVYKLQAVKVKHY